MLDNTVNKIPPEHRRLYVTIHGAEGLPPMDIMGKADSFVMCTVGKKSIKTKVSKATLQPRWEQQFVFGNENSSNYGRGKKQKRSPQKIGLTGIENITFVVKDWNRTGPAQFIGQVLVDILMMEGQPVGIPGKWSLIAFFRLNVVF